jgi:hypothetical protein
MARGITSFAVGFLCTLSSLLFLAAASLWATSYWTTWMLRADVIGERPGDTWSGSAVYVSSGGASVERSRLLGERPNESGNGVVLREVPDALDVNRLAGLHAPQLVWDRFEVDEYPKSSSPDPYRPQLGFLYIPRVESSTGEGLGAITTIVVFPLWLPTALFGALPAWMLLAWARRRRRVGRHGAGRCRRCGYDLRASPARCPECGTVPAGLPAGLPAGPGDTRPPAGDGEAPLVRRSYGAWAGVLAVPVLIIASLAWGRSFWRDQHATSARHRQRIESTRVLVSAARDGDLAAAEWALGQGAEVNPAIEDYDEDRDGLPLVAAMDGGNPDVVRLLVGRGADARVKGWGNHTLLHRLPEERADEVARALIEGGADVNASADDGKTALHHLSGDRADEVARLLIAAGADVNARTGEGDTPLHFAPSVGGDAAVRLVEVLVEAGADVNARDDVQGRTPLSRAISAGDERMIDFLLGRGAVE